MKAISFDKDQEVVALYIPHGSDESGIERISANSKSIFISHMVQMKDIEMPQVFFHPRLYIPHGSDER